MAYKSILTAARLRELLSYNPVTGEFTWLKKPSNRCRDKAGWIVRAPKGNDLYYRQIGVDGGVYWAHRLAWLWVCGAWPPMKIDHMDTNGLNNRWSNLRIATDSVSARNTKIRSDNASGAKGVHWKKDRNKWRVQVCGKHVGYYDDKNEAIEVAMKLRRGWWLGGR